MMETPTRAEVARAIVRAATPDDFAAAKALHDAFMSQHPDDSEMAELGELIVVLPAALEEQEARAKAKAEKGRLDDGAA